eukprot:g13927.t1
MQSPYPFQSVSSPGATPYPAQWGSSETAPDPLAPGRLESAITQSPTHLPPGPFIITTESNRLFDEDLRKRNPSWGLRDLEKVEGLAAEVGFQLRKVHNMPANNFLLVFERTDETGNERVEDYAGERRGYFAPAIQKYEWFEDRDRRRSPSDSET